MVDSRFLDAARRRPSEGLFTEYVVDELDAGQPDHGQRGPASIVVTVIGVVIAGCGLWLDLVERERQRTARSWQTVANELPGNTGKVEAAEYLAEEGHSLSRADFSPKSIRRNGDRIAPTCEYRVYLPALDPCAAEANEASLSCTDMGTDEEGKEEGKHAQFDSARLSGARFIRSNAEHASFADADLTSADFRAAQLGGADFSGATLNRASATNSCNPSRSLRMPRL